MKRALVALLLLGPVMAFAGQFSDALARAETAHEKCQGAWFKSSREAALKDLQDAVTIMLSKQTPRDELHDLQYKRAVGYFEECARLVHPGTFFTLD